MDHRRSGLRGAAGRDILLGAGVMLAAAMLWAILHAPGGNEVSVNVKRINSMREGAGGDKNQLMTGEVRCVISMDDGKLVNVIETCEQVRQQITELERDQALKD